MSKTLPAAQNQMPTTAQLMALKPPPWASAGQEPVTDAQADAVWGQPGWLLHNAGPFIGRIGEADIPDTPVTSSDECDFVCSYSWVKTALNRPTILVPGGPRKWAFTPTPIQIPLDVGESYVDENGHRARAYPFEPFLQALAATNPDARLDNVDVIGDRSSFRKLHAWFTRKAEGPFTINLITVKNTLFLVRNEEFTATWGGTGYGHTFEERFTEDTMGLGPDASTYHRVNAFNLGDLRVMVRHEVDAFYMPKKKNESKVLSEPTHGQEPAEVPALSTLEEAELDAFMSDIKDPEDPFPDFDNRNTIQPLSAAHMQPTLVKRKGDIVPQSSLAELKSGKFHFENFVSQTWWGRTPWLFRGLHASGRFYRVEQENQQQYWGMWEKGYQDSLRELVGLLHFLRKLALQRPDGKLVVVMAREEMPLTVYGLRDGVEVEAVPREMVRAFWDLDPVIGPRLPGRV